MEQWISEHAGAWELIKSYGVKVVGAIVALILAWIVAGALGGLVRRQLVRRDFDKTLTLFFSNSIRWAILAAAIIGILGIFGIETTSFAAALGAMGVAIGLALQGTLSNFAAGVMLLVFRPFKVDDFIKAGGVTGTVEELGIFSTTITSLIHHRHIVPNSAIFGSQIEIFTPGTERRVDINVGVEYSADIDETKKVLEAAAKKIPGVLKEPAPQVFLAGFGASSVDWQMRMWCTNADYWDVYQATIRATKYALDEAGIGIPFPQMDVHLDRTDLESGEKKAA